MRLTDPVADMLARIRNAITSRHQKVDIPASKLKLEIARILKEEGYIWLPGLCAAHRNSARVGRTGDQYSYYPSRCNDGTSGAQTRCGRRSTLPNLVVIQKLKVKELILCHELEESRSHSPRE